MAPGVLRLSLPGYETKEVQLTVGPLEWKNLYGVTMTSYYLLKSTSFHFDLEPVPTPATATSSEAPPLPAPTTDAPQTQRSFAPSSAASAPASVAVSEHPTAPITNQDVIRMVKAGIAEATILLDIRKGPDEFDTSPAALIELKSQGVPESVLRGMLRAGVSDSGDKSGNSPQQQ